MNETETRNDLTGAVRELMEKYGAPSAVQSPTSPPAAWKVANTYSSGGESGTLTLLPGWSLPAVEPDRATLPLLPWRSERRFVELKRIVDDRAIEPVLMYRACCMTDGSPMDLRAVLYREFDLAEWLVGSPIVALTANLDADRSANVILRLAGGVVCGVEAGIALPPGTPSIDRHELIARRGVASDRAVDTQVAQDSIYTFSAAGNGRYTDTDAELFGMSIDDACLVRSAYDVLLHFERAETLRQQHRRLAALVRTAFESDSRGRRLTVEGAC